MRKFFVSSSQILEKEIRIIGEDVNHIKNVLRLQAGEKIKIGNKDKKDILENYICEIKNVNKDFIECAILDKISENEASSESNVQITVFQGLPKADKMELIIQKGTELGVSNFVPVQFKRSIVKLSDKDEVKKIDRWQKIAEMASKQSGRDIIPRVNFVQKVKDICEKISEYDIVIVAYELEKELILKKVLKSILKNMKDTKEKLKVAIVIGPEGGIEEQEIELLKEAGAKIVSLGKRILRTETVALNMVSIIMYELET